MAHGTRISGVNKDVTAGFTRINGVNKKVTKGLTLVGGVQRDIKFRSLEPGMLGLFSNGDTVYIPENGVLAPFYVAKHNYESGLNGNGRTLLVRKDCFGQCTWGSGANCYDATNIDAELNTTYLNTLSNDVKTLIGTTGFYIRASTGSLDTKAIYRAVFSLSKDEYGFTGYNGQVAMEGSVLDIASAIRIANYNGNAVQHFTRTMRYAANTVNVIYASTSGTAGSTNTVLKRYYRPVFTMPDTTLFNESTGELDV